MLKLVVLSLQCDQIGLFLTGLGDKFTFKSNRTFLQRFGLF